MAENEDQDVNRILLIGKTGQGKSSTGNSIVRCNVFEVSDASTSQTKTCKWSKRHRVFGRLVEVVDTPGFFDTEEEDNTSIHKELIKSLVLTTPGFHAIAYVLKRGEKITKEHKETQALFFDWFGQGVEQYTFVILTHCETEAAKNKYLENKPQRQLTELIDKCGRRVVNIDNNGSGRSLENQVQCIFNTVDAIKARNGNHFTNVPFRLAEAYIRNKGPRELTKDSIIILKNAGFEMALSPAQSAVLETVQGQDIGNENSLNTQSSSSGNSDEESDVYSHSPKEMLIRKKGNILIIDDETEKQISNMPHEEDIYSRRNIKKKKRSDKMLKHASKPECSPEQNKELNMSSTISEDSSEQEADKVDFGSYLEISNELASDYYQDTGPIKRYESNQNTKDQEGSRNIPSADEKRNDEFRQIGASIVGSQKPFKPVHSTRKGRQIDPKSVSYTVPTPKSDPINDYKEEINNDNGYMKLNRLIEHFKNAWNFCKRKISGCSIS